MFYRHLQYSLTSGSEPWHSWHRKKHGSWCTGVSQFKRCQVRWGEHVPTMVWKKTLPGDSSRDLALSPNVGGHQQPLSSGCVNSKSKKGHIRRIARLVFIQTPHFRSRWVKEKTKSLICRCLLFKRILKGHIWNQDQWFSCTREKLSDLMVTTKTRVYASQVLQ